MIRKIVDYVQYNPFVSLFVTFVGILLYQCIDLFWGFEILDSGFHLTAFDNIFDAPDSISYNFMYYLTNVIGGGMLKLFPNLGILGFRMVGAVMVDIALILIFCVLRKDIPVIHLLIGAVLVVVCYNKVPYSLNNGICTCFFYVCFLILLYKGIICKNNVLLFLSGCLVGINVFTRIPNVLAVGLGLVILINQWFINRKVELAWIALFWFLVGVTIGVSAVAVLIVSLGHQSAFIEAMQILLLKGTSSSDTHSLGNLVIAQLYTDFIAVIYAASFFTVFYINKRLEKDHAKHIAFIVLASMLIAYHVYLNNAYNPLWALCMVGCIIGLGMKGSTALLAILALYMMVVEPIGSNSGYNHGSLPALLAAPLASSVILNRRNFIFVMVVCAAIGLSLVKQGNYFDFGPLSDKQYVINAKECMYIRTTQERASMMNVSLPKLKSYVHAEDTLLVYGSAPMLNYLTHTRPAGGMCWPGGGFFVKPFETAPKILVHKFEDPTAPTSQLIRGVPTGNMMIDAYMQEHQYQIVWENPYFILLFPQK